jgi:hypothetical protein
MWMNIIKANGHWEGTYLADEETGVEALRLIEDLLSVLVVPEADESRSTRSLRRGIIDDASVTNGTKLFKPVRTRRMSRATSDGEERGNDLQIVELGLGRLK